MLKLWITDDGELKHLEGNMLCSEILKGSEHHSRR